MFSDSNRRHPRLSVWITQFTVSSFQSHHQPQIAGTALLIHSSLEQSYDTTIQDARSIAIPHAILCHRLGVPCHAYVPGHLVCHGISLTRKRVCVRISVPAASSALFRMTGIVCRVRFAANLLNAATANKKSTFVNMRQGDNARVETFSRSYYHLRWGHLFFWQTWIKYKFYMTIIYFLLCRNEGVMVLQA